MTLTLRTNQISDTEQMRVLHLINRAQIRGAQQFAVRLAGQLESGDVQNAMCSLYTSPDQSESFEVGSLPMYKLEVNPTVLDRIFHVEPMVAIRLRRVLKDFNPDVIIGHGTDTLKYASVSKMMRRSVRTVYKNIGVASYWANTRSRVWFNRFWLRNIDCSVSVSEHGRRDFIEHYGYDEDRAAYIPNAVLTEGFDAAADPAVRARMRAELGVNDEDILVAMVGSLSHEKGQGTLIRAIAQLVNRGLPAKLILIGRGPERERLAEKAKLAGIATNVRFLGVRKDIPEVLSGMDIFALASQSEGMPGVLIEAGLSRIPSVAYDVGGVTEVLNDGSTGIVVPADNFEKLVEGLEELAKRPDWRAEMGNRARTWCEEAFDMTKVTNQYRQLFEQLLSGEPITEASPAALGPGN